MFGSATELTNDTYYCVIIEIMMLLNAMQMRLFEIHLSYVGM